MSGKLVVITGATGKQGGAIARELLAAGGWRIRAVTRKPNGDAPNALKQLGAEIVYGDLDDASSIAAALKGAWGALAVQNTWEAGVEKEEQQGKRFAHLAKEAGIQHIVYQSVASAHRNTGIPHFDNKWRVEQEIRSLEFPSHVVIRPVFFMENLLGPGFIEHIAKGVLAIGVKPETKLQSIAVRDIGPYGRIAFEKAEELNGQAIDIAGDELSGPEMAAILARVTGRPFSFYQVPIDQIRSFSEDYAIMLEWFDEVGYNADIEGNAKRFGVKPTRFAQWAAQQKWPVAETVGA